MAIRPWLMCCNKEGTMAQKKSKRCDPQPGEAGGGDLQHVA